MPREPEVLGRRAVLAAADAAVGLGLTRPVPAAARAVAGPAAAPTDTVVMALLGTGSPVPRPDRFGNSTLVQAGGLNLVFGAGRGCTVRLNQVGVAPGKVDAVFLTHFHSDHLNGPPDLLMTDYLPPSFGRRTRPLEIHGPPGTARMAETMRAAFADDVRIRLADEKVPDVHTRIVARDFAFDGVVFERGGVAVTAFAVEHGASDQAVLRLPRRSPRALGADLRRHAVRREPHRAGQGVDLLVHEVAVAPEPILDAPYIEAILDHHTTPEEAGTVFARTKPRMAAFSHIVDLSDENNLRPDTADIERRTRTTWTGDLVVGRDLDRFVLTPAGVAVQHFDHARGRYPG